MLRAGAGQEDWKKVKYLDTAQKWLLAFFVLFTTGLLFTNVVLRYFFHSAIFWVEELLRYCIVWTTFIGASSCVKEDNHISIDILSQFLKPGGKRVLKIVMQLCGIVFSALFLVISIRFVAQTQASGQVSATIGNLPIYVVYLCFPISFVLYLIRSFEVLYRLIRMKKEDLT